MNQPDAELEAVFIAANVGEIALVEELLGSEEIEYEVRPEPVVHRLTSGACLDGLLFLVLAGQAPHCRRLLQAKGLTAGIVPQTD